MAQILAELHRLRARSAGSFCLAPVCRQLAADHADTRLRESTQRGTAQLGRYEIDLETQLISREGLKTSAEWNTKGVVCL